MTKVNFVRHTKPYYNNQNDRSREITKNAGYVEIEDINELTSAEVQESDEFIIIQYANRKR